MTVLRYLIEELPNTMKTILLVALSLFTYGNVHSQTNYEITTLGSNYSITTIESAIQNIDLCGYFYYDHNRLLTFDDGAVVTLKKGVEVPNLETSCNTSQQESHTLEIWEITSTGHLIKRIPLIPAK